MKTRKVGSSGRFGARYGLKLRKQIKTVEDFSKQDHKCPYCNRITVKRLSAGIYECSKCESKFTGRAYAPGIDHGV